MKSTHFVIVILSVFLSSAFAQPADLIRYGQTINSDIGALGESDYYYFSAEAGDRFLIPIISLGSVDPLVVLYAPDGTELARANAPGLGWNSKLKAGVSNNYRIEVRDRSNRTGPYALSLFCLNKSNTADEGRTQIVPGRITPVSIVPGDFDIFEFQGAIGETFIAVALRTGGSYGPMFGIYGPDGDVILETPTLSGSWYGWGYEMAGGIVGGIEVPRQGTYRIIYGIRAAGASHDAGLTVLKHPWPNLVDTDGGELQPSVLNSGNLDGWGVDSFFFSATAGDIVNLRMTTAGNAYPAVWVLGPDGNEVADETGTVQASAENLRLPSTGFYLVVCYSWVATPRTGTYSIMLSGTIHTPQPMSAYFSYLGDTHQVFWLDRAGWNLERTDSVGPGSWLPESTPILSTGGFKTVNLPTSSRARFYRLVHP